MGKEEMMVKVVNVGKAGTIRRQKFVARSFGQLAILPTFTKLFFRIGKELAGY